MSPAAKRGPPTSGLSRLNWRFSLGSHRPVDEGQLSSMKATVFSQYGGPDVLRYVDMPDPVAQARDVVVDVYVASVNGADHKVRRGDPGHPVQFPHILGRDFSGVVSAAGPEVQDFAVGDAVFGVLDRGKEGAYAQKLVTKAAIIARKPDWLEHADAAALGPAGITAPRG